jgi:hypothetical protein
VSDGIGGVAAADGAGAVLRTSAAATDVNDWSMIAKAWMVSR